MDVMIQPQLRRGRGAGGGAMIGGGGNGGGGTNPEDGVFSIMRAN